METKRSLKILCIGGGAASFFFAAHAAPLYPNFSFTILEQGKRVMGKIAVSGGGRCNVTHQCFDPIELVKNYPRGERELLGPFYHFGPSQTIEWFKERGVEIKAEADGRMFPKSNKSQTIIDCLWNIAKENGVKVLTGTKVSKINKTKHGFLVETLQKEKFEADRLFVAAGSSKTIWENLKQLGFEIASPVPSLFTFNIKDKRIEGLAGISLNQIALRLPNGMKSDGPSLITHRGLSGPAILKLSARAAHYFFEQDYQTELELDWLPDLSEAEIKAFRESEGKKFVGNYQLVKLPKRLWASILSEAQLDPMQKWGSISKKDMNHLLQKVKKAKFKVIGQNRFKEEFVTAGGVELKEIDFNSFSSKKHPEIFLAGEILNIDAITGGYNFQACWTGAYIAAQELGKSVNNKK